MSGLVLKDKLRSSKYAAVRLKDSHTECCKFSASCINWEYISIKNGRGREASLETAQKTWVSVTAQNSEFFHQNLLQLPYGFQVPIAVDILQ